MKNEELLKPCEHCGGNAELVKRSAWDTPTYVECKVCGSRGPHAYVAHQEDSWRGLDQTAIAGWNTRSYSPASVGLDRDKLDNICSKFLMVTIPSTEAKNMTLEFDAYEKMLDAICHHFNKPGLEPLSEEKLSNWMLTRIINKTPLDKELFCDSWAKEICAKFGTTVKEVPTKEMIIKVLDRMEDKIFDIAGFKRTRRSVSSHYTEIIFKLLGGGQA